jgi:hypothetical protein
MSKDLKPGHCLLASFGASILLLGGCDFSATALFGGNDGYEFSSESAVASSYYEPAPLPTTPSNPCMDQGAVEDFRKSDTAPFGAAFPQSNMIKSVSFIANGPLAFTVTPFSDGSYPVITVHYLVFPTSGKSVDIGLGCTVTGSTPVPNSLVPVQNVNCTPSSKLYQFAEFQDDAYNSPVLFQSLTLTDASTGNSAVYQRMNFQQLYTDCTNPATGTKLPNYPYNVMPDFWTNF